MHSSDHVRSGSRWMLRIRTSRRSSPACAAGVWASRHKPDNNDITNGDAC